MTIYCHYKDKGCPKEFTDKSNRTRHSNKCDFKPKSEEMNKRTRTSTSSNNNNEEEEELVVINNSTNNKKQKSIKTIIEKFETIMTPIKKRQEKKD